MADEPESGIAEEEFRRWLTPQQALAVLRPAMIAHDAAPEIIKRCWQGLQRAAAETVIISRPGHDTQRGDFVLVTPVPWGNSHTSAADARFWRTASFEVELTRGYGHEFTYSFHGVRFQPDDIRKLLNAASREPPASLSVPTAASTARSTRGRKPNPLWEEAISDAWRLIYEGHVPANQAELEGRLADWFVEKGEEPPSETQTRQRAQMIWQAMHAE